jgi:chaperonin cofactor prefoldin
MAEEARKTFPMSTFVAYIKGEGADAQKENINDLLEFMTQQDIDAEAQPFAAALAKAWIYEQHPELASMSTGDVAAQGDNVSVTELPPDVKVQVDNIFAKLAEYRSTIQNQETKVADLEKQLAEANAKLGETEKELADYKGKYEALEASGKGEGEKVVIAAEEKVTELNSKLGDLAGEIDKVKSSIIAILQAAPTGEGGAPAAPAGGTGAPDTGGEPEADFGFGSDPFSDEGW